MKKFAFIGAGSLAFTRCIVRDLLTFPAFRDCEIRLMDKNAERLEMVTKVCRRSCEKMNCPDVKIVATQSRAEALDGADGVLCTVFSAGIDVWRYDIEIPKKFGVDINVGDTRSVSGIFRALRDIPLLLDICADIEKYCPHAVFLNYTNPMSMLCKAMQTYTKADVTGLCHSVQGTAEMLAGWLGYKKEDIDYLCAGVNHQAFYLRFEHEGKSLYPQLREKLRDPEYYNKEQVRNEMFLALGYYCTESSGHNSEYNQWFRKRPDLIEKYCTHGTGWNPGHYAYSLNLRLERDKGGWKKVFEDEMASDEFDAVRSHEYAAEIFNARIGDHTPFTFNGNVINEGCLPDLPADCCAEIPVTADRAGYHKQYVGKLPAHLAILLNTTARVENLAVEAAMEKSKEKVYRALCFDPLTSAVCSLAEIREMTNQLFEVNREFLKDYK